MNEDRIAEVYEGTAGTPHFQRVSRQRIHWLCRSAEGECVLDIGCSQGIASLLLAREGKTVVGIDRELVALEAARERLAAEEEPVRARVTFIEAEAASLPFEDGSVDSALLGEVLEHQLSPKPVVEEATRVVKPGGVVAITTPYGFLRYHDHKEPLYIGDVLAAMPEDLSPVEVALLDRYLVIRSRKSPAGGPPSVEFWQQALRVAERRLAVQDQEVDTLQQAVKASEEKRKEAMAELSAAHGELARIASNAEALKQELARHRDEAAARRSEASAALDWALRLSEELDDMAARAATSEEDRDGLARLLETEDARSHTLAQRVSELAGALEVSTRGAAALEATGDGEEARAPTRATPG